MHTQRHERSRKEARIAASNHRNLMHAAKQKAIGESNLLLRKDENLTANCFKTDDRCEGAAEPNDQRNLCSEHNKRFHVLSSKKRTLIHSRVRLIKAQACACRVRLRVNIWVVYVKDSRLSLRVPRDVRSRLSALLEEGFLNAA